MILAFPDREMSFRVRFDQPLSDEALERFSLDNDPWRVERDANGELIMMTPVNSRGGRVEGYVYAELAIWSRIDGRSEAFGPSAGFRLEDTSVRAADAAWMSLARWNGLSREQQESFAPVCPEFVIEVRSKSDRLATLEAKMEMWIANGAQLAWMIDPERRAVAIYRPGDSPELLQEPTSVQGTGAVAGFELIMSRIWQ